MDWIYEASKNVNNLFEVQDKHPTYNNTSQYTKSAPYLSESNLNGNVETLTIGARTIFPL